MAQPRGGNPRVGLRRHPTATRLHLAGGTADHRGARHDARPGKPVLRRPLPKSHPAAHHERRDGRRQHVRRPRLLPSWRDGALPPRELRRLLDVGHLPRPVATAANHRAKPHRPHDAEPRGHVRERRLDAHLPLLELLHGSHDRRPLCLCPCRCFREGARFVRCCTSLRGTQEKRLRVALHVARISRRHGAASSSQLSKIWFHPPGGRGA